MDDSAGPTRWGILGTARIAERLAQAMHAAGGAELRAVASRSLDRAASWGAAHGAPRAHGSYEALLDDPEVDAVYIPLPPSLHAEWTIRAAERGKHVLCEKPLACSVAEAEQMQAACAAHRVQLMDGVMWVHHPRTRAMHEALHSETVGPLRRVTSAFTFDGRILPAGDHRFVRALGGGALLDLGWYCVRAALWALGDVPERVFGSAQLRGDVDAAFSGLMWFGGDRMASFDCGYEAGARRWLEVAGRDGSLVCDDFTKPWNVDVARFWLHGAAGKASVHHAEPAVQEVAMIEAFCRAVRGETVESEWARVAVATQRVCDALARSARARSEVEVD